MYYICNHKLIIMEKEKFLITKFNRANGTLYYRCELILYEKYLPKTFWKKIINIFRRIEFVEYSLQLHETGSLYMNIDFSFPTMNEVLKAIDNRVKSREEEEGMKVVSTEIEVIIK